jgi:hypothetical protein
MRLSFAKTAIYVSGLTLLLTIAAICTPAFGAEDASKLSAGDTAWVLTSLALVLLMTARGLALFMVGWSGAERIGDADAQFHPGRPDLGAMGSVRIQLAFAPWHAIVGGLQWMGLCGVSDGAQSGLRRHHSASGLYGFPMHVCGNHTGPHNRLICRAHLNPWLPGFQPAVDNSDL